MKSTKTRRFKRIKMDQTVRFLATNNMECSGKIVSISAGDIAILSTHPIGLGERIVAYVQGIDRFEGIVRSKIGQVFSIELHLSDARREKLIEKIMFSLALQSGVIERHEITLERRISSRQHNISRQSTCKLSNGASVKCSVVDMSMTGLAIEIDPILAIYDIVQIGCMKARVMRVTENGYGLEFIGPASKTIIPEQLYQQTRANVSQKLEALIKFCSKKSQFF